MSLKNPVIPPGIDPGTVRLVAQLLKHYATPGPYYECNLCDLSVNRRLVAEMRLADGCFSQVTENSGKLRFRNRRHTTFEMDRQDFLNMEDINEKWCFKMAPSNIQVV
jgi:hypothetical protein